MTTTTNLDAALLELIEQSLECGSIDRADLEAGVTRQVVARLYNLIRHARCLGALYLRGSRVELVDREVLASTLTTPIDNVVKVPEWGPRRPHLLAGNTSAEVVHLDTARVRRRQRTTSDPPPPLAG